MPLLLRSFGITLLVAPCMLAAQYWGPAGFPIHVSTQLKQFHYDEEYDTFHVCGRTHVPYGNMSEYRVGILRNQAGIWDTLGLFNSDVTSVIRYGDTLIVGGFYTSVNGAPPGKIAAWINGTWTPYGTLSPGSPHMLRKINNEVYMVGTFHFADGQLCNGVAKRSGGQWVPVGNIPPPLGSNAHQVFDIIEYNGQLVVTGNINTAIGDDVFILEGEDWVPLGGGVLGWNSYGKRLAEYQGDLYLAGGLSVAAGDPGQCIIRWDGAEWHPVGSGLQAQLGNNGPFGGVEDMLVHNDELFVCGGFSFAGGIPARGVARWNGQKWCSVGGNPSNTVFCMGFFQDTLYINNPGTFDGQDFNFVAKFVAPEYEDNCGLWVGVEEGIAPSPTFTLHPNPTTGLLHVELNGLRPRELWVSDALGRVMLRQAMPGTAQGTLPLDLAALGPGAYLVTVLDAEGMRHTQRLVRE